MISEEDYLSKWVTKGKIVKKEIIEPKGRSIEETTEIVSEEPVKKSKKSKKKKSRDRSRSQDKKKSKKSKKSKKESKVEDENDVERQNIKKWLLSSSAMSPDSQRKFLKLMGVKESSIDTNFDLIEASKESEKFKHQNDELEKCFVQGRKNLSRGKRGL